MGPVTPKNRSTIQFAALEELMAKGIDGLTTEGIAARAGVHPSVIIETWGGWRPLFLEAAISESRSRFPTPDTGNLRDDLLAVAAGVANVPEAGWFRRMLAPGHAADLSEIRADYWTVRAQDFAPIFQRADERGELIDDIDPVETIRMFFSACLHDVIFADTAIRSQYTARLVDLVLRGVTRTDSTPAQIGGPGEDSQ